MNIHRRLHNLQALVLQSAAMSVLSPTNLTPDSLSPGGGGGDELIEELRRTIAQQQEEIARLQPPAYENLGVEGDQEGSRQMQGNPRLLGSGTT